jgi:hypothetical protein
MAERALKVMRLIDTHPLLDPGITLAMLVIALKLIGWHLDHSDTFCISE